MKIDWYFDFISPFAYLQFYRLRQQHRDIPFNPIPILFGAVLKHHGHKGPAEIPGKRVMTYRYCQWYADQRGIPFTFPEVHPFKPIMPLRLGIALGGSFEIIEDIFNIIWVEGHDLNAASVLTRFCADRGIDNIEQRLADPKVKDALRTNTDQAIAKGVFGVPTLAIGDELFWGVDMLELALQYRDKPELFSTPQYQRLQALPNGLYEN